MLSNRVSQNLLVLGFTAVFIAYLMVWLPGPAAGLSFMGVEMGEWIKFMGMGVRRNWFYLPPITLGVMLAVWTVGWENGRWQSWVMRGVAVGVSLLSFPAFEDLRGQVSHEYLPRVEAIVLVVVVVVLSGVLGRWSLVVRWKWLVVVALGFLGMVMPTVVYGEVRTAISDVLGLPIGYGLGVWLNGMGHGLVTAVAGWQLSKNKTN